MKRTIALLVALAVLALFWWAGAPRQLGGSATYVTTHGTSMQPGFSSGDLAILRPAASYAVGDVVAYRSAQLNTVVMHRIVAVDGDRFTLQGDNNPDVDPEQPSRADLLGRLAVRVPQGGTWFARLTSPLALGLLTVLLLTTGTAGVATKRRRRAGPTPAGTPRAKTPIDTLWLPASLRPLAAVAAATLVVGTLLAAQAWVRPTPVATAKPSSAPTGSVAFSYRADVSRSAAYDGTTVTDPQPIFRALTDAVTVSYTYTTDDGARDRTMQVSVELRTANGWESSQPVGSPSTAAGLGAAGDLQLRLPDLQRRADAAAAAIGGGPPGDVAVTVVAQVSAPGAAPFRAELPFILDAVSLRLAQGAETVLTVQHAAGTSAEHSEAEGTVAVFGLELPVDGARWAAAGLLLLAVVAAASLLVAARRAWAAPEEQRIQARYGRLLTPVQPLVMPAGRPVIDVPDIAGLARVATGYGLLVLYWERGGVNTYVVLENNTTYRYRNGVADPASVDDNAPPAGSVECVGAAPAEARPE